MNKVKVRIHLPLLIIMFLIMFALKLAGVGVMATASWWIVTAPLWGPFALAFSILAFFGIVALFAMLFSK